MRSRGDKNGAANRHRMIEAKGLTDLGRSWRLEFGYEPERTQPDDRGHDSETGEAVGTKEVAVRRVTGSMMRDTPGSMTDKSSQKR